MTSGPKPPTYICSRCGTPQPAEGPLRADDGTAISAKTFQELAALAGDALICSQCVHAAATVEFPAIAWPAPGPQTTRRTQESAEPAAPDLSSGQEADAPEPRQPTHREVPLDEEDCWQLMGSAVIGRLGLTDRALPLILPAHFVVRDREVVIASLPDPKVANAGRRGVVAFEVDGYDPVTRQGWCVSTVGRSRLITDPEEIRALDSLDFAPWTHSPDRHYIAIELGRLRGIALTAA